MRIGIIYVGHQTAQYIGPSLTPWIRARNMQLNGDQYVICVVSVPFVGFPNDEAPDATVEMLKGYESDGSIDKLITSNQPMRETEARGAALTYLIQQGADAVWQVDSDEFYTLDEITAILKRFKSDSFVAWARVSLKNYVFDTSTYLIEPFTPPRIHRVQVGAHRLTHFAKDNDLAYGALPQDSFSSITIPSSVAWPKHLTWMSNERSHKKVLYQTARGWQCSYRWNEATKQLEFDERFYARAGRPLPEVARD